MLAAKAKCALLSVLILMTSQEMALSEPSAQYKFDAGHTGFNQNERIINVDNVGSLVQDWSKSFGFGFWFAPAVSNGTIYQPGNGRIFALSSDGALLRTYEGLFPIDTPAIMDGALYAAAEHGELIAFDASSNAVLWRRRVGDRIVNAVLATQSAIVAGNEDGRFKGFDPKNGALLWSVNFKRQVNTPCITTNTLFTSTVHNPATGKVNVIAFDIPSKSVRWTKTLYGGQRSIPACLEGMLIADTGDFVAYDEYSGAEKWRIENDVTSYVIAKGRLVSESRTNKEISAFSIKDGSKIWSTYTGKASAGTNNAVAAKGIFYSISIDYVRAHSIADGSKLWQKKIKDVTSVTVSEGSLYTTQEDGTLRKFSLPR